jgi:hypothetical protein
MDEDERSVIDALGGERDGETVVAAQWFRPFGSTGSAWVGFRRVLRQLFGKGDGLPPMGVLAVTPTRLLLLDATTNWSGFAVGRTLETWPLRDIALRSRRYTWRPDTDQAHLPVMRLTVVTLPDGREVELPRSPMASSLLTHANRVSRPVAA